MGQCPVKKYNEQLLHLIEVGRIDATKIVSHPMELDDAPKGYEMFDRKEDVTKVVFKPWKVKEQLVIDKDGLIELQVEGTGYAAGLKGPEVVLKRQTFGN